MTFPQDFDLVTEPVRIAEFEFMITRPRAAEDLIDETEYADDQRLPYWADLWPSGLALARGLAERDITGARILELGAGLCAAEPDRTRARRPPPGDRLVPRRARVRPRQRRRRGPR